MHVVRQHPNEPKRYERGTDTNEQTELKRHQRDRNDREKRDHVCSVRASLAQQRHSREHRHSSHQHHPPLLDRPTNRKRGHRRHDPGGLHALGSQPPPPAATPWAASPHRRSKTRDLAQCQPPGTPRTPEHTPPPDSVVPPCKPL